MSSDKNQETFKKPSERGVCKKKVPSIILETKVQYGKCVLFLKNVLSHAKINLDFLHCSEKISLKQTFVTFDGGSR